MRVHCHSSAMGACSSTILFVCGTHAATCGWLITGAADYKWNLRGLEGEALGEELRRCHLRSAARMVKVAGRNGGVYIKAGQHLGQMVGLRYNPQGARMAVGFR
jgi:hypothetical protein